MFKVWSLKWRINEINIRSKGGTRTFWDSFAGWYLLLFTLLKYRFKISHDFFTCRILLRNAFLELESIENSISTSTKFAHTLSFTSGMWEYTGYVVLVVLSMQKLLWKNRETYTYSNRHRLKKASGWVDIELLRCLDSLHR